MVEYWEMCRLVQKLLISISTLEVLIYQDWEWRVKVDVDVKCSKNGRKIHMQSRVRTEKEVFREISEFHKEQVI
jgi:hypothetical protein